MGLACWNCGHSLDDVPRPISRHATCNACFNELHCCRLCKHYRRDINSSCDEERADPPTIKENANFCDWFAPRAGAYEKKTDKSDNAKDKLDALFGHGDGSDGDAGAPGTGDATAPTPPETKEDLARSELEALFRKND